jgi:hypothetical protein
MLEKRLECNGGVHQVDFKKAYDLVRWEIFCSIHTELRIPRKVVGLIKMCLNETCSIVCIDRSLSDKFPIQNGLKQGDDLSLSLLNFALEYAIRRVQENQKD